MSISPEAGLREHFLYPSEIFASGHPTMVQTILGSCVSVCIYDNRLCIGGINHFMLPLWNGQGMPSPKYGDVAVKKLIDKLCSLGSAPENLVAKIFGGADQLSGGPGNYNIGSKNIVMAESMLVEMKISILARSTGGLGGRKIIFNTATNQVLLKTLKTVSHYGERN
jgi:chemotaxis protein CheD